MLPSVVVAQGFGKFIGVEADDIRLIVVRLFQIFWVLVGIACASVAGYGIYLKRTGGDDIEEQSQAKKFMIIGGIGVAVVILISIILAGLYGQMAQTKIEEQKNTDFEFPSQFFSELMGPGGKIQEHYPARDARNIPRNSKIVITFKESISIDSVRDAAKKIKNDAIRIQQVFPQISGAPLGANALIDTNSDHTVITIAPDPMLGEKNKKSTFAVTLTNKIKNEKGENLFSSQSGYSWQFEISGIIDNTPPQVESAMPLPQLSTGQSAARYPFNHLIQITFTKPIDPLSVTKDRIEVVNEDLTTKVLGSVTVGNEFRTVTFIPQLSCGKNACGETVFCLPQKNTLRVTAHAASVPKTRSSDSPNRALFPYDGIADMMGNSFDGGGINAEKKNGSAEGPPVDSFAYSFATSDQFFTSPPEVVYVKPTRDGTNVDLTAPVVADFSTFMDLNSLHTSTLILSKDLNYWISNKNDIPNRKTTSTILHDTLKANTIYKPHIQSGARSITQQCFNPCIGPTP